MHIPGLLFRMTVYASINICRSCLSTESSFLPLDSVVDSSFRIIDCLRDHLNIAVSENDGLPFKVCLKCLDTLLQIRRFHIRYLESEQFLLSQCASLKRIKQEADFESATEDENQSTVGGKEEILDLGTQVSEFSLDVSNTSGDLSVSPKNQSNLEDADPTSFKVETLDDFEQLIDENEDQYETKEDYGDVCQPANEPKNDTVDVCLKTISKTIYCLQCHEQFNTKNNLRTHFHAEHGEENARGFCKHCSQTFPNRGQLMSHLHTHKFNGPPRHICSFCGRKFNSSSKRTCHERTHTGEKPYICPICNRGFCQSSVLRTHMSLHTGKSVQCELCDKKFSRRSFLKIHLRSHSDTRPYECHLCDKKYRIKSHLNSHLSSHSEERKFSCEVCGQSFREKCVLRSHMSVHTRPYKCPQCPLRAAKLYSFRIHLIKMHDIHDDPKLFMIKQ